MLAFNSKWFGDGRSKYYWSRSYLCWAVPILDIFIFILIPSSAIGYYGLIIYNCDIPSVIYVTNTFPGL